jgi:hypothetical protein
VSAESTTGPTTEYDIEAAHRALLDEGKHLHVAVVDELTPITQKHTIEGLVMGEA